MRGVCVRVCLCGCVRAHVYHLQCCVRQLLRNANDTVVVIAVSSGDASVVNARAVDRLVATGAARRLSPELMWRESQFVVGVWLTSRMAGDALSLELVRGARRVRPCACVCVCVCLTGVALRAGGDAATGQQRGVPGGTRAPVCRTA